MSAEYECPECKRPLVSRRNKRCLYCGEELPEQLLFTKAEIEAQDRSSEEEEKKRKAREKAREEEDRKRAEGGDAGYINFGGF